MGAHVETLGPISDQSAKEAAQLSRSGGPWIYGPWLDLLVGCGGWSAPLLLVAALLTSSHVHAWAIVFYALAVVFNYPHFMATEYRAYRSSEDFQKYKFFTLHITLLLALTGVLAHTFPRFLPWIFTLYIYWSPWHYTGQNYGLLSMFVCRGGAKFEARERRWLRVAFAASYLMLLASFQTGGSNDPLILSLGLPARFMLSLSAALGLVFAVCAFAAFRGLIRRAGFRAMIAPLTLLVTQFLWFVLPTLIELWTPYQIPQTRYSSGILAVLHSAQYLWITSYYQQRHARATGDSNWRMSAYWLVLIAGGIALFIPGPWLVSYAFHFDFATSFLIFTALVNIHHFLLDGAIWKLRDSRVAARLIGQGNASSQASVKMSATFSQKTGTASQSPSTPLAAPIFASQALRIAVVALLFLLGGADQLRFALGTDSGNLSALSSAATMNPYDSAVDQRIGSAQLNSGHPADAVASLSRAVAINPYSQSSQRQLALALIQNGRYADAYAHYRQMLKLFPQDTEALLNYGVLAAQLGHAEEAVNAWKCSIAVDPSEASAHMYLAAAYDQRGDYAAAAQQWYSFLQLATSQGVSASTKIPPDRQISALLQLSDDEARLNQTAAAITGYKSAISLAQRVGSLNLESLALAHLGDVQEKTVDAKAAANSYEKGLALDQKSSEAADQAADWFNYAQFLQRHSKPDDLAYACLLQAESLFSPASGQEERQTVHAVRQQLAQKLGKQAAEANKNQAQLVATASSLPPSSF
jgi:Flp pilus assembly protein TadD